MNTAHSEPNDSDDCLLKAPMLGHFYQAQAEDILTDDDLLDLFRIVKQILRKKPDTERTAKLLFCISYALGDSIKFSKPMHDDRILFRDASRQLGTVILPAGTSSCCTGHFVEEDQWSATSASPLSRILSANGLDSASTTDNTSTESFRPYTHFPAQPAPSAAAVDDPLQKYPHLHTLLSNALRGNTGEVLMEPKQRGFYYQDGRIAREPALLQRYAEQGVLTQASLMRKRKRQLPDINFPYELATLPGPAKKPKIPHRHGEFEQRRDDIISRMRSITLSDLEQKAQRLPENFILAIEQSAEVDADPERSPEEAADLLEPALRILTIHSNMKPHLDNGMNQNGIYYNADYFRLYLAFDLFQRHFGILFPHEVVKINSSEEVDANASERDRERNANMKAYRGWIEPLLTETNWAAFRRNIVVGERMMQLTKVVGQGVLLMTKELSGSKLHLTFTNNEWEDFINGLGEGRWDDTIKWESEPLATKGRDGESMLVAELQRKFGTQHWFTPDGKVASSEQRRVSLRSSALSHSERFSQAEEV